MNKKSYLKYHHTMTMNSHIMMKLANFMMMMVMRNCFCGMVDRRKAFSLTSSWNHCQTPSPPLISGTPRAGFEPTQNLSSGLVSWMKLCSSDNPYTTVEDKIKGMKSAKNFFSFICQVTKKIRQSRFGDERW